MKLHNCFLMLVMGCIAMLSWQNVQAQEYQTEPATAYAASDDDTGYYEEMMYYFFGDEYAYYLGGDYVSWFEEGEGSIQAAAAADSVLNLTAVADGPIFVNLKWTGSHYSHKIYANGALKYTGLTLSGTNQSHTLVLSPSTYYTIKVTGFDRNGVQTGEKTASATTPSNVPSGVAVASAGTGQVRVRWNYLKGMSSYKIYRSSNNGVTWITCYSGPGYFSAGNEVSETFSCPAGSYKFAVTSYSSATGESSKSTAVSFTVQ